MSATPSRYRVGGNSRNLSVGSAAGATSATAASNNQQQQQQSPITSGRRSSSNNAGASSQSPANNNNSRRHHRRDFDKEHTEVGKTLSFAPADILAQRRMMCARRNELGAEKVVCGGRVVLDSSASLMHSSGSGSGHHHYQAWNESGHFAAVSPVDAPSPLDRNVLQLSPLRNGAGGSMNGNKNGSSSRRRRGGADDLFGDSPGDNEDEEEEEEGLDDGFEELPHSLPLPDWRVLAAKELYKREQDEMELIRERYSVATNPAPTKGRRRSTVMSSTAARRSTVTESKR